MIEIVKSDEMQDIIIGKKRSGKRIGVVPTMGYLHEGHRALIREARQENDIVVLTIFVNPTQFGPGEDFDRYPRDIDRDRQIATDENVDYIFHPSVDDMYPEGYATYVDVEKLTETLEGEWRPGHFRGVTTIVLKLFQITQPHNAYFGQKDAQQFMVIKKMVHDLHIPVAIKRAPTVREEDGLALSSRNVYLSPGERKDAAVLYRALRKAEQEIHRGERSRDIIVGMIRETINTIDNVSIDYVDIVDPDSFHSVQFLENNREHCIALAVRIGKIRLIDNIFVL